MSMPTNQSAKRRRPASPRMHSTTETPLHTTPPVNDELLRKFGLRDHTEIETLEAFLHNMLDYGCEPLIRGMTTMFIGMQNAASLWTDLREENRSLNAGSVLLRQELDEAKDHSLTETLSTQKAEVGSIHTFVHIITSNCFIKH